MKIFLNGLLGVVLTGAFLFFSSVTVSLLFDAIEDPEPASFIAVLISLAILAVPLYFLIRLFRGEKLVKITHKKRKQTTAYPPEGAVKKTRSNSSFVFGAVLAGILLLFAPTTIELLFEVFKDPQSTSFFADLGPLLITVLSLYLIFLLNRDTGLWKQAFKKQKPLNPSVSNNSMDNDSGFVDQENERKLSFGNIISFVVLSFLFYMIIGFLIFALLVYTGS